MRKRLSSSIVRTLLHAALLTPVAVFAQQDFGSQAPAAPPAQQQQAYPQQAYPQQASPQQAPAQTGYPPQQSGAPMQGQPAQAGYPSQPAMPPQQGEQFGNGGQAPMQQPSAAQGQALQALLQHERQDYGVPPQAQLQQTMHGPTPTSIPGGQMVTTDGVLGLIQQASQNGVLIFHVLGPGQMLPGALNAAPASQAGSFSDQTQQEFGQYLQQVTQGNKARPMVFYCMSTQCWMSYNAALRAINMGFTNVLWYRGGLEAWQQAQQLASGMQPPGSAMPGGNGYR